MDMDMNMNTNTNTSRATDVRSACFKKQEDEIINICKSLLAEGAVNAVLAYADGEDGIGAVPRFFRKAEELASMRWSEACTPNLAKYLLDAGGRIAVAAKPCDARAIVMYMAEKQVDRSNIYIIGIECAGLKGKDGMPAAGCAECTVRMPPVYDVLVKNPDVMGSPGQNRGKTPGKIQDNTRSRALNRNLKDSARRFKNAYCVIPAGRHAMAAIARCALRKGICRAGCPPIWTWA
ncbi:MAG: hypothetical protein ACOX4M_10485 [Acetivibrionales bacterium]